MLKWHLTLVQHSVLTGLTDCQWEFFLATCGHSKNNAGHALLGETFSHTQPLKTKWL